MTNLSNSTIEYPCPECGSRMRIRLSQSTSNASVSCPRGHRFKLEGGPEFRKEMRKIDQSMSDLNRALRKLR